uniref:Solute carrier family 12 member 9 n=1 Tax=Sinocyclocheilus anshuiensis TaxID=1608454 RepID=A0A671L5T7_9TELE
MANEHSPLLVHGVYSMMGDTKDSRGGSEVTGEGAPKSNPRKLNTFFGVMVPTILSMFSIVLFLRTGFVVGHAGLLHGFLMLFVAYFIISLTILSICAISTNGAVEGGGAYFMISRSLGPEFGGSIGLMFYLAKVCACGVYVLGLVDAILDIFGKDPGSAVSHGLRVLPQGYWYTVLYSSLVLLLCLVVCLVGAHIYAKASFIILLVVTVSLISIIISPLILRPQHFNITHTYGNNHTVTVNPSYTGFNSTTLKNNLGPHYSLDYSTNTMMSFATVFAVMFTSCTGIMAGANMSGELKNPSESIPKGTIMAVSYTFTVYVLLFLLLSSTCDRLLLINDYAVLQRVNVWPPFVTIGVYCASLSAAMCSMIGASRILHALALDQLFGLPLAPAAVTSSSGNPWVSVLYTWGLVQCTLFAGQLNVIAGIVTVFYLLAYAAVDLACLALEWASAPNFRYCSKCVCVCACVCVVFLCCFQVRKYLLMLDSRKDHVKFWRPQVLLMVANPRSSCQLICFVNQLKKGGLFVLGHVQIGDLVYSNSQINDSHVWFFLVNQKLVLLDSYEPFLFASFPGGMKPNTLVLGFYDNCYPEDYFLQDPVFCEGDRGEGDNFGVDLPSLQAHFPPVRHAESPRALQPEEYVSIIHDAIKMGKNVCLGRYFFQLPPETKGIRGNDNVDTIDVWPTNLLSPGSASYADVSSLFLLQMACVLNMANKWRRARLRIFVCVESESGDQGWLAKEEQFRELLGKLRIRAAIKIVAWDDVARIGRGPNSEGQKLTEDFLCAVNALLREYSSTAAVRFLYLPHPPSSSQLSQQYLTQLDTLTRDLGPTLLIHGVTPVTCTEL